MRKAILIAITIIALGYLCVAFFTLDGRSDDAKVRDFIASGIKAVQDRNVTAVISCISPDYNDDAGVNYDRLRILIAQAIKDEPGYLITTSKPSIKIRSNEATVMLHVTLKHPAGVEFYDRDITLELAQQNAYHMLIIPTKQWQVVGTTNLGLCTAEESF